MPHHLGQYGAPHLANQPIIRELYHRRIEKHINGKVLAKRCGFHENSIYNWERGRHEPNLASFIAWANALGMEVTLCPEPEKKTLINSFAGTFAEELAHGTTTSTSPVFKSPAAISPLGRQLKNS